MSQCGNPPRTDPDLRHFPAQRHKPHSGYPIPLSRYVPVLKMEVKWHLLSRKDCQSTYYFKHHLPWNSARFHFVGDGDIIGPDVKLPFPKTKNPTENGSWVHTNSHCQFHLKMKMERDYSWLVVHFSSGANPETSIWQHLKRQTRMGDLPRAKRQVEESPLVFNGSQVLVKIVLMERLRIPWHPFANHNGVNRWPDGTFFFKCTCGVWKRALRHDSIWLR